MRIHAPSILLSLALMWLGAGPAGAGEPELRTLPLGAGLHLIRGAGGNVVVSAGTDGVFLVDDKVARISRQTAAAIRAISRRPLRFILNTHWHADHTGGNLELGQAGAVIIAHDNVRRRMSSFQLIEFFQSKWPPSPAGALPVVTFTDAVTLHLNGDAVRVLHVPPAHTDGDSLVHFRQANVVHMGDTYYTGIFPLIDLSSGGHIDGFIAAADVVLALADDRTRIIPGHGEVSDRGALAAYRAMLVTVRKRVRAAMDAGQVLEQIIAARPTAEFDAAYGAGFVDPDTFVRLIHQALTGQTPGR